MTIDEIIFFNKIRCTEFEEELATQTGKYKTLRDSLNRDDNDLLWRWYGHCNEDYGIQRRIISDYLKGTTISEKTLNITQYRRQIGERIYPLLLRLIFATEQILTELKKNNDDLKESINQDIKPLLESLDNNWTETNKDIRDRVITSIKQGLSSFAKLRNALVDKRYITEDEGKLLQKIWMMRNASHNKFIAINKIEFSFKNQNGKTRKYKVKKGKPLYTPNWLITELTEELSRIVFKILSK